MVKGTLHWVSAAHAVDAEVRMYEQLFAKPNPDDVPEGADYTANLNPNSLTTLAGCKAEPGLADLSPDPRYTDGIRRYQFMRQGYFSLDPDSTPGKPVFNRTVTLKDTWAKVEKGQKKS